MRNGNGKVGHVFAGTKKSIHYTIEFSHNGDIQLLDINGHLAISKSRIVNHQITQTAIRSGTLNDVLESGLLDRYLGTGELFAPARGITPAPVRRPAILAT